MTKKANIISSHGLYLADIFLQYPNKRLERKLRKMRKELLKFEDDNDVYADCIAVRGLSGIIPGAILANRMKRQLVVCRKLTNNHSDKCCEGRPINGGFSYVVLDDCIDSGKTLKEIKTNFSAINFRDQVQPRYLGVLLYNHSPSKEPVKFYDAENYWTNI